MWSQSACLSLSSLLKIGGFFYTYHPFTAAFDGLFYDKSRDKANDRGPLFPREDTKNKDQIFHFAGGEDIMSLMVELSSPRRRENINERAIKCVVVVAAAHHNIEDRASFSSLGLLCIHTFYCRFKLTHSSSEFMFANSKR